jgi:hypothetical protein
MCFPLPLPIVCRGGRKRNWEARQIHPSCAEGRVAANGPQGRYAPLTRWPLRPSLTAIHCYAAGRAGRDGGMVLSVEHRDGNEDEVLIFRCLFMSINYRGLAIAHPQISRQFAAPAILGGQNLVKPPSLSVFAPR